MATAKQERERAARGEGCLGKAADDEPVFILRGQDMSASSFVAHWADLQEHVGKMSPEKIAEARECATAMRLWRKQKWPD